MDFTQWLQNTMEVHNLTVYQISKISGVHQSTIANWIAGAKPQEKKKVAVINTVNQYLANTALPTASAKKPAASEGDGLAGLQKQAIDRLLTLDEATLRKCLKMLDLIDDG